MIANKKKANEDSMVECTVKYCREENKVEIQRLSAEERDRINNLVREMYEKNPDFFDFDEDMIEEFIAKERAQKSPIRVAMRMRDKL